MGRSMLGVVDQSDVSIGGLHLQPARDIRLAGSLGAEREEGQQTTDDRAEDHAEDQDVLDEPSQPSRSRATAFWPF